jgi:hypothetical protein
MRQILKILLVSYFLFALNPRAISDVLSFIEASIYTDIQNNDSGFPIKIPWDDRHEDIDDLVKDIDGKDFYLPTSFNLTSIVLGKKFKDCTKMIAPNPFIKIIIPPPELS